MLKLEPWMLFAVSLLLLLSCCTPKPPDVAACESLVQRIETDPVSGHLMLKPSPTCMEKIGEPECGHCVYIVSANEIFVGENEPHLFSGKRWSELKTQMVMLPAKESYSPLAAYLINSCKKMHCSEDLEKFKVKLDSLKTLKPE